MLDTLKSLFIKDFQMSHVSALLNHVANIMAICNEKYLKDATSKNAAIDEICEILQNHKDVTLPSK